MTGGRHTTFDAAMGTEDNLAALTELQAKFASGEIQCAALRHFRPDGTWEDIVLGGDERQRAEALLDLQRMHQRAN
jgi:hypothetical protein